MMATHVHQVEPAPAGAAVPAPRDPRAALRGLSRSSGRIRAMHLHEDGAGGQLLTTLGAPATSEEVAIPLAPHEVARVRALLDEAFHRVATYLNRRPMGADR